MEVDRAAELAALMLIDPSPPLELPPHVASFGGLPFEVLVDAGRLRLPPARSDGPKMGPWNMEGSRGMGGGPSRNVVRTTDAHLR